MNPTSRLGREWPGNVRGDVLAGLVVAAEPIPPAVAGMDAGCATLDDRVGVQDKPDAARRVGH